MWPFGTKTIVVPAIPPTLDGIRRYHDETSSLIEKNRAIMHNPLKMREYSKRNRIIDARQNAMHAALDRFGKEYGLDRVDR